MGIPLFRGGESFLKFGSELHRSVLEPKTKPEFKSFTKDEKARMTSMRLSLEKHKLFQDYMNGADKEITLHKVINGVRVRGTLDIRQIQHFSQTYRRGGDIKTTSVKSEAEFIKKAIQYDYLRQAWIYTQLSSLDVFTFFGVQKYEPYKVFVLHAHDYPKEYEAARKEAVFLLDFYRRYGHPKIAA